MADLLDFLPLRQETLARIRARMEADANAGVDPSDPSFLDTTVGGFWWDLTQVAALEAERLWDMASVEVPAAAFPTYAFGRYLDEHGAVFGLTRRDAVQATGEVTFTGTDGVLVPTGTQIARPVADPDGEDVAYETTESGTIAGGVVTLAVQAVEAGATGNAPSNSVTALLSPIDGVTATGNALAITGGSDVETDEDFRARLMTLLQRAQGAGTVADYEQWALSYPGIGFATVQPLWGGPGTVRVVVTDTENSPVSPTVVAALQALLDPVAGEGRGLAPVGAVVTVATPTTTLVNITAKVEPEEGYSLDGTDGTVALRGTINDRLEDYVGRLKVGEEVVRGKVQSAIFRVTGVHDVALTVPAANVAIGATQVAELGTVTLTEGTVP